MTQTRTRTRTLAHRDISSDSDSDWNTLVAGYFAEVHTCLLIPEILRHIFSDIYLSGTEGGLQYYWERGSVQPERGVARRSLVALSCVCRSFKDVALDILWAELENLEPLFTSLPRDLWTLTEQQYVIRRPVTMNDWAIFGQYASRVRVLGNTYSDLFGGVNTEFVHAIMAFSSNPQLVPNLRALCCGFCPPVRHPCMRYLLGPSLVCIRLASNADTFWTNIMSSLISGLGRHTPQLEVVALRGMSPEVTELALSEPGLPHLRRVSLTSPTNKTLLCLSRLAGLGELDITIPEDLEAIELRFRTTLRRLAIRISPLTSSQDLAGGWVVPCRHLELFPDITASALDIEYTLRRMNDRLLCNCLRSILLHGPKSRDHVGYAFTLRTFTPLLRFSGLKSINLATCFMSLLTDDALDSVVKSWPCLEELYLGTEYFWRTKPKVTFEGLVSVLSSCPNLRKLGLVFDTTKLRPYTAEKPGGGIFNTNITVLDVGFSPIKRVSEIAVALSAILPCLTEISVELGTQGGPDRDERIAKWKNVLGKIKIYSLIRKQEHLHV